MTGQSLFPDEYPTEPSPPRRLGRTCCADETAHPIHDPRLWHIVHVLGHTRIPFSVGTVAAMAEVDDSEANAAVHDAVDIEWLRPAPAEAFQTDPIPLWFGRLPKR